MLLTLSVCIFAQILLTVIAYLILRMQFDRVLQLHVTKTKRRLQAFGNVWEGRIDRAVQAAEEADKLAKRVLAVAEGISSRFDAGEEPLRGTRPVSLGELRRKSEDRIVKEGFFKKTAV